MIMEILRIKVYLTDNIVTKGGADTAVMLPFTGECDSPLFKGKILPGGVDTQRIYGDGYCEGSGRRADVHLVCEERRCFEVHEVFDNNLYLQCEDVLHNEGQTGLLRCEG